MTLPIIVVVVSGALFLSGCSGAGGRSEEAAKQSVYSALRGGECKQEIDKADPNSTPYLSCPGAADYTLNVKQVESGRQSVDIVDTSRKTAQLNFQDVVTRHMSNLGTKAEWRVTTNAGKQVPIAVIVPVEAREDSADPEKVTHTYLAVAKITSNETCVTDRLTQGAQSEEQVRALADSAQSKSCVPVQPPLAP